VIGYARRAREERGATGGALRDYSELKGVDDDLCSSSTRRTRADAGKGRASGQSENQPRSFAGAVELLDTRPVGCGHRKTTCSSVPRSCRSLTGLAHARYLPSPSVRFPGMFVFLSGVFFGGALDHAILAARRSPRTPYGVEVGVAGNWALAGLDLALAAGAYAMHRHLS
jgi:hypothetical protein